jgi:hypothetical protein
MNESTSQMLLTIDDRLALALMTMGALYTGRAGEPSPTLGEGG